MLPQAPPVVERLHTGFRYVEGAAVDRQGNLYFADVPAHRIYRRSPQGKLTVLIRRSEGTVGLEIDRSGRLLGAQNRTGRIVSFSSPRWTSPVVSSPNDLVLTGGGVYVTSPDFRGGKRDAIYYVPFAGTARVVDKKVRNPNGIGVSPDGRTLYVVGYGTHDLVGFPILGPGRLGAGKRLMKLAGPGGKQANTGGDGLGVGPDGTLYVAVPEAKGIHVATPQGRFLRFFTLPEKPSNCAVSSDGRFLFVTAQSSVYRVRL